MGVMSKVVSKKFCEGQQEMDECRIDDKMGRDDYDMKSMDMMKKYCEKNKSDEKCSRMMKKADYCCKNEFMCKKEIKCGMDDDKMQSKETWDGMKGKCTKDEGPKDICDRAKKVDALEQYCKENPKTPKCMKGYVDQKIGDKDMADFEGCDKDDLSEERKMACKKIMWKIRESKDTEYDGEDKEAPKKSPEELKKMFAECKMKTEKSDKEAAMCKKLWSMMKYKEYCAKKMETCKKDEEVKEEDLNMMEK